MHATTTIAAGTANAPLAEGVAAELAFPLGLSGFPNVERFALRPIPGRGGPFHLLRGLGTAPVDLVVVPMEAVGEPIASADVEAMREGLGIDAAALLVLLVVTLPPRGSGQPPTVNVRAPIFVDVVRRTAVQAVLPHPHYAFRAPLAA